MPYPAFMMRPAILNQLVISPKLYFKIVAVDICRCNLPCNHRVIEPVLLTTTEHIANVLNSAKGNKTRAAEILEVDRKTLLEKIRRANLPTDIG